MNINRNNNATNSYAITTLVTNAFNRCIGIFSDILSYLPFSEATLIPIEPDTSYSFEYDTDIEDRTIESTPSMRFNYVLKRLSDAKEKRNKERTELKQKNLESINHSNALAQIYHHYDREKAYLKGLVPPEYKDNIQGLLEDTCTDIDTDIDTDTDTDTDTENDTLESTLRPLKQDDAAYYKKQPDHIEDLTYMISAL